MSLNRYSYTYNSPLNYIDPSGHVALEFLTFLKIAEVLFVAGSAVAVCVIANGVKHRVAIPSLTECAMYMAAGTVTLIWNGINWVMDGPAEVVARIIATEGASDSKEKGETDGKDEKVNPPKYPELLYFKRIIKISLQPIDYY